jgi:hypothetical protein
MVFGRELELINVQQTKEVRKVLSQQQEILFLKLLI